MKTLLVNASIINQGVCCESAGIKNANISAPDLRRDTKTVLITDESQSGWNRCPVVNQNPQQWIDFYISNDLEMVHGHSVTTWFQELCIKDAPYQKCGKKYTVNSTHTTTTPLYYTLAKITPPLGCEELHVFFGLWDMRWPQYTFISTYTSSSLIYLVGRR